MNDSACTFSFVEIVKIGDYRAYQCNVCTCHVLCAVICNHFVTVYTGELRQHLFLVYCSFFFFFPSNKMEVDSGTAILFGLVNVKLVLALLASIKPWVALVEK